MTSATRSSTFAKSAMSMRLGAGCGRRAAELRQAAGRRRLSDTVFSFSTRGNSGSIVAQRRARLEPAPGEVRGPGRAAGRACEDPRGRARHHGRHQDRDQADALEQPVEERVELAAALRVLRHHPGRDGDDALVELRDRGPDLGERAREIERLVAVEDGLGVERARVCAAPLRAAPSPLAVPVRPSSARATPGCRGRWRGRCCSG